MSTRPNWLRAAAIAVAAPEVALEVGGERDGLRALAGELLGDLVHELGAVDQGDRRPLLGPPWWPRPRRGPAPRR